MTQAQTDRLTYLKTMVSARVDEYLEDAGQPTTIDLNFGDVEFELRQATRFVLSNIDRATSFIVSREYAYATHLADASKDQAVIPLPDDYLRFVRLRLSGWNTDVNTLRSDADPLYPMQQFRLSRGTAQKPIAFQVPYHSTYAGGIVGALQLYATVPDADKANVQVGDGIVGIAPIGATVIDASDPDYVVLGCPSQAAHDAIDVNDTFTVNSGQETEYVLTIAYKEGQAFTRKPHGQAIEAYPAGTGVESLIYVPQTQAYDLPVELEDVLIWKTVQNIAGIMGNAGLVQVATGNIQVAIQRINQ